MDARLRGLVADLLTGEDPGPHVVACRDVLVDAGFQVQVDEAIGALVAERGSGGVVLSGHLDVVPAGEGWTLPPHEATFDDGRVWGRGSADMRGAVACMLAAVEDTDAPVRVVLTTDEETTMHAVRALAERGIVDGAPLVVVGEPTSLRLAVAGKGVAWMRVGFEGRNAHASTPELGASVAQRLVETVAKVPLAPYGPDHELLGRATLALTGLSSGDRFNILPASAEARFDSRFPPPLTPQDAVDHVAAHVGDARIELAKEEPSFEADPVASDRAREVLGEILDGPDVGVPFASEAGHWSPRAPTVLLGPGDIGNAHAPDESVAVDELERAARMYARLVEGLG